MKADRPDHEDSTNPGTRNDLSGSAGDVFMGRDVHGDVNCHGVPSWPGAGKRPLWRSPGLFLSVLAFALLCILVISGAFYVRGRRSVAATGNPTPSLTISGTGPQQREVLPMTRPPVAEANIGITADTDPRHLGSSGLSELAASSQEWMIPKRFVVRGDPGEGTGMIFGSLSEFARKYQGATAVSDLYFNVTLQNLSGGAVYLRSMRLVNLVCHGPLKGTLLGPPGGAGPAPPRIILIDLEAANPAALYFEHAPEGFMSDPINYRPRAHDSTPFGFTLSRNETESFDIVAIARRRLCDFTLEIVAVINGQNRTVSITDSGRSFRVTGIERPVRGWFQTADGTGKVWSYLGSRPISGPKDRGARDPLTVTHP